MAEGHRQRGASVDMLVEGVMAVLQLLAAAWLIAQYSLQVRVLLRF
jgi:hypothetical protein